MNIVEIKNYRCQGCFTSFRSRILIHCEGCQVIACWDCYGLHQLIEHEESNAPPLRVRMREVRKDL
jgi:hypothetical protein